MKAVKAEEIFITTENRAGALADLSNCLAKEGINIRAVCAYVDSGNACFRLITSDTQKAKEALGSAGYKVEVKDIVICELEDKVGMLGKMADILKSGGIDLTYIYGTTSSPQNAAIVVFSSSDNSKAQELLSAV